MFTYDLTRARIPAGTAEHGAQPRIGRLGVLRGSIAGTLSRVRALMRTRNRLAGLTVVALLAGAAAAPVATAEGGVYSERAGDVPTQDVCAAFADALTRELAFYGIVGRQAESYIAQRADNPCHARITPRSLFHAGDPGL
jgi:hypothetical protein